MKVVAMSTSSFVKYPVWAFPPCSGKLSCDKNTIYLLWKWIIHFTPMKLFYFFGKIIPLFSEQSTFRPHLPESVYHHPGTCENDIPYSHHWKWYCDCLCLSFIWNNPHLAGSKNGNTIFAKFHFKFWKHSPLLLSCLSMVNLHNSQFWIVTWSNTSTEQDAFHFPFKYKSDNATDSWATVRKCENRRANRKTIGINFFMLFYFRKIIYKKV